MILKMIQMCNRRSGPTGKYKVAIPSFCKYHIKPLSIHTLFRRCSKREDFKVSVYIYIKMTQGIHFNLNRGDALKVWTNEIRLYRSGSRCLLPRKVKCSSSWIIKWTSFIIISWLLIITRSDTILFARFYWLDMQVAGGVLTHTPGCPCLSSSSSSCRPSRASSTHPHLSTPSWLMM